MKAKAFLYLVMSIAMVGVLSAYGCASGPSTAQTKVFGWQQRYNQAMHIGSWYGKQAFCDAPIHDPVFCADRQVVLKIESAVLVAGPAVKAAQATARNPLFDESTASQLELSASAAVAVLTAITDPLLDLFTKAVSQGMVAPAPTGASMQALPAWDGSMNTAAIELASLLYILNLLRALMRTVPEGTALWRRYKADKDKIEEIVQRGKDNPDDPDAGKPTDEEWDALNEQTEGLEAEIKANADRARDPSN